jgi:hypothetical protein
VSGFLYITEFADSTNSRSGAELQIGKSPAVQMQKIPIGSVSQASLPFDKRTKFVRLQTTKPCHVVFGSAPTATTNHMLLSGTEMEYFGVYQGQRLAVVGSNASTENRNAIDAFGRLRIGSPTAVWYDTLEHDLSPLLWSETAIGAGSGSVHAPNKSAALMTVGATQGDLIRRTTRLPIRYQPGKSRLDMFTWGDINLSTGARFNVGAFCCENGVFFSIKNGEMSCVVRSFVSGAVVDNVIPRASWSYDKLDGAGPSGLTLDITKAQIGHIDLEWLSVGQVRFSLVINGVAKLVHEQPHSNILPGPYMSTANLPIQYELINEDGGAGGSVLAICNASISEGGETEEKGYIWTANNGVTGKSVTTAAGWVPIVSIRRAELFKGIRYHSGIVSPRSFSGYVTGAPAQFGLFYRPTLTDPTWVQVNTESGVEQDTVATALTGGFLTDSTYISAGGQGSGAFATAGGARTLWLLPIADDWEGGNADVVTLAARSIGGTATVYGALEYKESR